MARDELPTADELEQGIVATEAHDRWRAGRPDVGGFDLGERLIEGAKR